LPLRLPARVAARWIAAGLLVPCVYFAGAGGAFFYRQRAVYAATGAVRLPEMPTPVLPDRLLVFAPHCDDETLGCGGLIQQTLAAGGAVQTVMLTNGDGFRTAVERQARTLRIGPQDYIHFAALRQGESHTALEALGIAPKDILFLGYPDRGLMALWDEHWAASSPYASLFTHQTRSPYANTFDHASRYCGQDLLADIKATLRAFRPTLVTVTHPADDHSDHAAAAAFVARAVQELQTDPQEKTWAANIRLRYYLVHRGDWPLPQGAHPDAPLLPPVEMRAVDTRWESRTLTPAQTRQKARSIGLYPSQVEIAQEFLTAFARRTEIFGTLPEMQLATVPAGGSRLAADAQEWETLPPALLDPARDTVLRDLQGGGDIRTLYACHAGDRLRLRLDTRQPISARFVYTVRLRAFGPNGETALAACALRLGPNRAEASTGDTVQVKAEGRTLVADLPWEALTRPLPGGTVRTLAVSVTTTLGDVEVDKTGMRFLQCP
jgi:LmbE family N-acetylglucosaminyl deacetylase